MATPALRGALQEWGSGEGGQGGRELALLLLVNAPRAGAKNRGGEIFRQSQDAFGRRRERGREGAGGGEERGRKGGGEGDLSFQIHALRASEGQPWVWDPGQAWLWEQWAQAHGDNRTPQLARPGRTRAEAKINAQRAQREACGRPQHILAPRHTTGFCPCRARGTGGAHSGATTAAQPHGKLWRGQQAPSCSLAWPP